MRWRSGSRSILIIPIESGEILIRESPRVGKGDASEVDSGVGNRRGTLWPQEPDNGTRPNSRLDCAKPHREEPDALIVHVRDCGGAVE